VKKAAPEMISTLVHGIVTGIAGLASVLFGLSLAGLGTFFLLKDGPGMRRGSTATSACQSRSRTPSPAR
jgi:hypothetical protein